MVMLSRIAHGASRTGLHSFPCSFYRGGTSKGLLWSTATLARLSREQRDRVICWAMGSPDPDRRQIDGLGGGISSLSKTAIVGAPDAQLGKYYDTDGIDYADSAQRAQHPDTGWDLVYRFGQVPIEQDTQIDWTSTCGNLVACVALFGLHQGHVSQERIRQLYQELTSKPAQEGNGFSCPVRILVTASGQIIRANVPVTAFRTETELVWVPDVQGDAVIAGVPGTAPGILIETPLQSDQLLPTGHQIDTVSANGVDYPVTVINAGLPTIFVSSDSLSSVLDPAQLAVLSAADLDANTPLMTLLEQLRQSAAALTPFLRKTLSPSAPKICIVHPTPAAGFRTSGGTQLRAEQMDVLIRAVSVGNMHRTVPATCLSALACGRAFPESTIAQAIAQSSVKKAESPPDADIISITVGQPAGLSEASIKLKHATDHELKHATDHERQLTGLHSLPDSIVYMRTARRIMQGLVDIPHSLLH